MSHSLEETVTRLRQRLWIERGLFVGAAAVSLGVWLYPAIAPSASVITVDGRPVVSLKERPAADAALAEVKAKAGAGPGAEFAQVVRITRGRPSALTVADPHAAAARLKPILKLRAQRGVIYVDGQAVAALPDTRTAQGVLDQIQARYTSGVAKLAAAPVFKEKVEVRSEAAEQDLWADAETAVGLLTGEGSDDGSHTVLPGETAWKIARKYRLSEAEFRTLNAGADLRRLHAGQTLRVSEAAKPLVTVVTEGQTTRDVVLSYETVIHRSPAMYTGKRVLKQAGKPGRQHITEKVRFENGVPVARQVLSRTVLTHPQTKIVVLGGKPRPAGA